MRVHVGTSGYNYPEWRGTFYPAEFPAGKMFAYYAERFRTVEINYTFYRMPTKRRRRRGAIRRRQDSCTPSKRHGASRTSRAQGQRGHGAVLLRGRARARAASRDAAVSAAADVQGRSGPPRGRSWAAAARLADRVRVPSRLVADRRRVRPAKGPPCGVVHRGLRRQDDAAPGHGASRVFPVARRRVYARGSRPWAERVAAQADVWDDAFVYFKHEEEGKGPEFAHAFLDRLASRDLTP